MESADGFAEVFPEHKYMIVQTLRKRGWVTAMTGDGVNDAPALKRADIGIAVEGSTDAARAAADIVLSAPGLSTIVTAIYYSRKIFQRMKNYVVYRIACTLQLVLFIFVGVISVDPSKYNFGGRRNTTVPDAFDGLLQHRHEIPTGGSSPMQEYFTMPVIALVLITILNDGCIVAISHDNVVPGPKPESWAMHKTTTVAIVLAFVACISSVVLLFLAMENGNDVVDAGYTVFSNFGIHPFRSYSEVQIVMYLKISLSDFLTVFSARTTNFFTSRRPGYALLTAACVAMGLSTILAVYWPDLSGGNSEGDDGEPLSINGVGQGWRIALFVWVYCIICFLIQDLVKVFTYSIIDNFFSGDEDAVKADALKKSETRNLMSRKDEVARDHSHATSAERKAMFKRSLSDAGHVQSISFESDGNAVDESAYSGRRRSISITNEYRGGWRSMVPAILRRIRKLEKKVVDLQQQVDNKKDK